MSLKEILRNKIKQYGYLSYGDMCQMVSELGYKVSNSERRLREMNDVEAIRAISKRSTEYISGYKWVGEPVKAPATVKEFYDEKYKEALNPTPLFVYKVDPKHSTMVFRDPN